MSSQAAPQFASRCQSEGNTGGRDDRRNLFPQAVRACACRFGPPGNIVFENDRGLGLAAEARFR
jgi:hypothetical protein